MFVKKAWLKVTPMIITNSFQHACLLFLEMKNEPINEDDEEENIPHCKI